MVKAKLPENILREIIPFYLNNHTLKETSEEVYKKYNIRISPHGIKKRLVKAEVRMRSREEFTKLFLVKKLPKEIVKYITKLYTKDRLPIRKIAKKLKINRTLITRTLKESKVKIMENEKATRLTNTKHKKLKFRENYNEKAYLTGLKLGDLYTSQISKYTLGVNTGTTHTSFLNLLQLVFKKYGPIWIYPIKNKKQYSWNIHMYLDLKSFNFLLNKNIKLNSFSKESFFHFLAGLIDSDGSIIIRKAGKYFQYIIRIFNQDTNLLNIIKNQLNLLGFKTNFYINNKKGKILVSRYITAKCNKDNYVLELSQKKQVIKLLKQLPIKHPEKILVKKNIFNIYEQNKIYYKDIEKRIKNTRNKINTEVKLSITKAKKAYNLKHHPFRTAIGLTLATKLPIPAL